MLTHLHIKNFKAWRDTGPVRLAPLTVIFGANSAGKSSLGHLLLALKQTALSSDRRRALLLGDANTLIDLGTFRDCLYDHNLKQPLVFELGWRLPEPMSVIDPLNTSRRYRGDVLQLEVTLDADEREQPRVQRMAYALCEDGKTILDVELSREPDGNLKLTSSTYNFVKSVGRQWKLGDPEKFYRVSDVTLARFQNASFLIDFSLTVETWLRDLSYLGPLRDHPRRTYQWAGDTPEDVGQKGQFAVPAILAATYAGRKLNRGPKTHYQSFEAYVAGWLKEVGVIHDFAVRPVAKGLKDFEVLIRTHAGAPEVRLTDVGIGVSQVLPALVQAFYAVPNSLVWMEQPELHLHPRVQAELADAFIMATKAREDGQPRNVQLIVESHSEHFLTRLQRRVAEEMIAPEDVAVYFCRRSAKATELVPLELNVFGDITNWPENFFGDEMEDLTARTMAAMRRRRAEGQA